MTTPSSLEGRILRLEGLVEQIARLEQRLKSRIDRLLYWQLGLMASIAASVLATVLTRLL